MTSISLSVCFLNNLTVCQKNSIWTSYGNYPVNFYITPSNKERKVQTETPWGSQCSVRLNSEATCYRLWDPREKNPALMKHFRVTRSALNYFYERFRHIHFFIPYLFVQDMLVKCFFKLPIATKEPGSQANGSQPSVLLFFSLHRTQRSCGCVCVACAHASTRV